MALNQVPAFVWVLIALIGIALILHVIHWATTRRRQRDEEQARTAGRPRYSISLGTYPTQNRPSSREYILPNAAPPAYIRRTSRQAEFAGTGRPLTNLPALYPTALPPVPPPQSPIFIVGRDSTDTFGSGELPPQSPLCIMGNHSNQVARSVVPPPQPSPQSPMFVVGSASTASTWSDAPPPKSPQSIVGRESTESVRSGVPPSQSPTCTMGRQSTDSTWSQATMSHSPAINVRRDSLDSIRSVMPPPRPPPFSLADESRDAVRCEKPLPPTPPFRLSVASPLSSNQGSLATTPRRKQRPPPLRIPFSNFGREPLTKLRTGVVQARQPVVTVQPSPKSDAETGNVVSNMVKSMEEGRASRVSSKAETCDASESPDSTLMSSVMNRISYARQQWSKIDAET